MAVGDTTDFVRRLRGALPAKWFPVTAANEASSTPVLDAVLTGIASQFSWLYSMLEYTDLQGRIQTASGIWLDMIAAEFFGVSLSRNTNELDAAFKARILAQMFRPKVTRPAVVSAIVSLTGRAPIFFEPRNPSDTGGYDFGGVGYDVAGGYGDLNLPFQCFVTAYRPIANGIANIMGSYYGSGWAGGGYDEGAIEYATLDMMALQVTDADIQDTITSAMPAASTAWLRISN